ncbi:diaminopimelate dehydrogenase [Corynebacterium sp. 6A]|uniref:diaminopimelate dehydrogenase n=1 Tax=Corynebacterium sp. 6A TaxID=2080512 RepID=UPI00124F1CD9|nr:diaminopimelate dehydrogenase [Corynebacterium sp. 6A]
MSTVRAGIVGYGNLGKSVEKIINDQPDMELAGIFTRRDSLDTDTPVFPVDKVEDYKDQVDVLFLCVGSATDIPEQAVKFAEHFTTVDTYDNHHDIPRHYRDMDAAAKQGENVAVVSTGWDPGMFSLNRVMAGSFINGQQSTFWGPGLSQGHSDALRRIEGVKKAVQYTLPDAEVLEKARNGEQVEAVHKRQCWVVADESEHARIEEEIRTMPDYFVGYEVEVNFIDEATFDAEHTGMPHGGYVISHGHAGFSEHLVEYKLQLERNPDFTGGVMVAYGRAAHRLAEQGKTGAFTVLEVAPYLLSATPLEELIAQV